MNRSVPTKRTVAGAPGSTMTRGYDNASRPTHRDLALRLEHRNRPRFKVRAVLVVLLRLSANFRPSLTDRIVSHM